jgi:hypothetical protein
MDLLAATAAPVFQWHGLAKLYRRPGRKEGLPESWPPALSLSFSFVICHCHLSLSLSFVWHCHLSLSLSLSFVIVIVICQNHDLWHWQWTFEKQPWSPLPSLFERSSKVLHITQRTAQRPCHCQDSRTEYPSCTEYPWPFKRLTWQKRQGSQSLQRIAQLCPLLPYLRCFTSTVTWF